MKSVDAALIAAVCIAAAPPTFAQTTAAEPDAAHRPQALISYAPGKVDGRSPFRIAININDDADRFYPHTALLAQQSGESHIRCDWNASGIVTACQVINETPVNAGFGAAAVALAMAMGHVDPIRPDVTMVAGAGLDFTVAWKTAPSPCAYADAIMKSDSLECAGFANIRTLGEYYPARAADSEVEGESTLDCAVADEAGHVQCAIVDEKPPGYMFGASALKTTIRYLRVKARQAGQPITGTHFPFSMTYRLR